MGMLQTLKEQIKGKNWFYRHLAIYLWVNLSLLKGELLAAQALSWSLLIRPVLWGVGLVFHGIRVFSKKAQTK